MDAEIGVEAREHEAHEEWGPQERNHVAEHSESPLSQRLGQRVDVVVEHVNARGGAEIKYGLSYKNENKVPALERMKNVPKFLITLSPAIIVKAMDTFSSPEGTKTTQEKMIVDIILKELIAQAEMYLENKDMSDDMKGQLKTAHIFLTKERELAKE